MRIRGLPVHAGRPLALWRCAIPARGVGGGDGGRTYDPVMSAPAGTHEKVRPGLPRLQRMAARGEAFAALTCYDAVTARWLTRAGVHLLLVGDTAAEMVLGFRRTIDMPLEVLLALTAGVRRGAESAGPEHAVPVIMGDMPFMSYHASPDEAVRNAGRFLVEGGADLVKLEVDATFAPLVERLSRAGVPVCAHVGARPQRAAMTGGYTSAGRTPEEAERIVGDARAMLDAGAVMLLVEAVPESVTAGVLEAARRGGRTVPVIGIGAGAECDGQVVVVHDMLGLTDRQPAFAPALAELGASLRDAGEEWVRRVAARSVGASPYRVRSNGH
jgi:3-methyl-2-oxobutanoate hydroxymethyltransferase